MIRKIYASVTIALMLIISLATIVSAETITYTDDVGDVIDLNEETINRPNVDIEKVSAVKNGKQVELKLKLAEGGTIQQSSINSAVYMYSIYMRTSHYYYNAVYTGFDISSLSPEDLGMGGDFTEEDLEDLGLLYCYVTYQGNEFIDDFSFDGEGENELSIKFNLLNSNEKIIALSAEIFEESAMSSQLASDEYTGEELTINISSLYNATTGNPVYFEGNLEEEDASDYEWTWYFEETNTLLTGLNTSYTFKIPDIYDGVVYTSNEDGDYGVGYFSVNVTGDKIVDNGDDNGSPGFEVIIIFAAIAVVLIGAIIVSKRR